MANHLDFLEALDAHVRSSAIGVIQQGGELNTLAWDAGLAELGNEAAARWTGQLVDLGFLSHGPKSAGDPRPLPVGPWTPQDIYRFGEYTITAAGHTEAETVRRRRRDGLNDAALGGVLPNLVRPWMTDGEKRAVREPLMALRTALAADQSPGAIGAAKDLLEASCKLVVERADVDVGGNPSLPTLFKLAHRAIAGDDLATGDLGRSLASTAQRLAELRNAAGAGHGRASAPAVGIREARLAASASTGLSVYLLSAWT
jgi:hypothetical protein